MDSFKNKLILLHHCRGIGWKSIKSILLNDSELTSLYRKNLKEWHEILPQLKPQNISSFFQDLHSLDITQKIKSYSENQIQIKTVFDPDYPSRLKHVYNPPWILYMKGKAELLHQQKLLAVVGSRKPTDYGRSVVDYILPGLINAGYVIVSGLAYGIDKIAHENTVSRNGKTIAVLGGGLFQIYPKENTSLALKMMDEQLVISEIPPFRKAEPWMFPLRNRIISGLSDGVLIVEAKEKSGTLITAYQALEQGREVFAIPGNITSPSSIGTNILLQDGAKLVLTYEDIENEIQSFRID